MSFSMFSAAGNQKCAELVEEVKKLPITATNEDIYAKVTEGLNKIGGEAWDTEVRASVIGRIEKATGRELTIYF